MKKAKTPRAPDYTALANQQAATAKQNWQDTLQASRPNQTGPQGSLTWEQSPTGEWTQSVSMTPERQGLYDLTQQKAQEQLAGYDTGQVDFSGAPAMPTARPFEKTDYSGVSAMPGVADYSQLSSRPTAVTAPNEQVMNTIRALRAPEIAQRENAARARLAAQGVSGGERIVGTTEQNLADAASRADLDAILAGYGQSNTAFGQQAGLYGQDISNLNTQFAQGMAGRQQGVSEVDKALAQSNLANIQEFGQGMDLRKLGTAETLAQEQANQAKMAGMMGQSNSFTMPTFAGVSTPGMPGAATPDTMGAAQAQYQAAVDAANAKNASNPWNQIIGIGSKLAGAYLGGPGGAALGSTVGGMMTGGGVSGNTAGSGLPF